MVEETIFTGLTLTAFALLVIVTGGVGYLTALEWRDRRRREQDKRIK
jgi:hypothetical protein